MKVIQKQYENVKAKVCLWCEKKMAKKSSYGRVGDKICPGCKTKLKDLRKDIGVEKWLVRIQAKGIGRGDIINCYKDYK